MPRTGRSYRRQMVSVLTISALIAMVLVAVTPGPTSAATVGDLSYDGCIANSGANDCQLPTHNSLAGARGVAVSPNGANLYATSFSGNSVTTLNRNAETGALTYAGCIANGGANGCDIPTHDSLGQFDLGGIAVSPDGANVYAAAYGGGSVTTFDRDLTTGVLTYSGCIADGGTNGCESPAHDSLGGAEDVVVSPDGTSVYVTAYTANSVTTLTRDPSTGALTYAGCIADNGDNGCDTPAHNSLGNPYGLAISPDGTSLYVSATGGDSVTTLGRDNSTGALTYAGCIANGGANDCDLPAHDSLADAYEVAVSPDGTSVYATATDGNSITTFSRNPAGGALTYAGCLANSGANDCDIPAHNSLAGAEGVVVSPDRASVYVTAYSGNSVTTLTRNTNTGTLTYAGCVANSGANDCDLPAHNSLAGGYGVAISPNGKNVYTTAATGNSVTTFTRSTPSPPAIAAINPASGPAAGGTVVTITGSGFDPGASVSIGGTACVVTGVTTVSALTCVTGAHAAGIADVTVTNPDTLSDTQASAYTYLTPSPTTPQLPAHHCVTPGSGPRAIPRAGIKQLMKPGCVTNAHQRVGATVRAVTRHGDTRPYRLVCNLRGTHRATRKLAGGYRYCPRGALSIKTNGTPLKLRISWHAAQASGFTVYNLTRSYRT